ncbi:MAG TPA: ABC transporter substrate-binding protein [Myxococcota bacterium]|nr:ABC transporter substrate-binding protein [Myxococcota bacterium]
MTVRIFPSSAALALAALLLLGPSLARADGEVAAAKAALQQAVDETLAILNDTSLAHEARLHKLEGIALAHFDFRKMTQLVLGKNRTQLSEAQQAEFMKEFQEHLALTYGKQFDKYTSNEKIVIGDGRLEANKDVTLRMRISGGSAGDGVRIDYRMRADGGQWRVIDVLPEGVSMVQNFRSQVQDIVTQKGVGQLIQTLHEKNAARAQSEKAS